MSLNNYLNNIATNDLSILERVSDIVSDRLCIASVLNDASFFQQQNIAIPERFLENGLKLFYMSLAENSKLFKGAYAEEFLYLRNLHAHPKQYQKKLGEDNFNEKLNKLIKDEVFYKFLMEFTLKNNEKFHERFMRVDITKNIIEENRITNEYAQKNGIKTLTLNTAKNESLTLVKKEDIQTIKKIMGCGLLYQVVEIADNITDLSVIFCKSYLNHNNGYNFNILRSLKDHLTHNNAENWPKKSKKFDLNSNVNIEHNLLDLKDDFIKHYSQPYCKKENPLSVSTEGYINFGITVSATKNVVFSELSPAHLKTIDEACSYFENSPNKKRSLDREQAYLIALANIANDLNKDDFRKTAELTKKFTNCNSKYFLRENLGRMDNESTVIQQSVRDIESNVNSLLGIKIER